MGAHSAQRYTPHRALEKVHSLAGASEALLGEVASVEAGDRDRPDSGGAHALSPSFLLGISWPVRNHKILSICVKAYFHQGTIM